MRTHARVVCLILVVAMLTVVSDAHAGKDPPAPVFDAVAVTQMYAEPIELHGTSTEFKAAVEAACTVPPPPPPAREVTGAAAAILGLIVDWLFNSAVNKLSARVQKHLKAYTVDYSNDLSYGDIFEHGWKDVPPPNQPNLKIEQTCVIAQRLICDDNTGDTPKGDCEGRRAANSVAFLLNRKGPAIRVLPIGFDIQHIRAKHAGKEKFAASYSLKIHAVGVGREGGYRWDSGEAVAIAEDFELAADDTHPTFWKTYPVPTDPLDPRWAEASVLPLPPVGRSGPYAAYQVTFAEVGQPKRYVKHFATFLAANQKDVSKALGEAAKKKLKIDEE